MAQAVLFFIVTIVTNKIRITSDEDAVECREGKTTLVLKTCFLKKA